MCWTDFSCCSCVRIKSCFKLSKLSFPSTKLVWLIPPAEVGAMTLKISVGSPLRGSLGSNLDTCHGLVVISGLSGL